MVQPAKQFEAMLHEKLAASETFRDYQDAFRSATGLPLRIVSADPDDGCLDPEETIRNPLCDALAVCKTACHACLETSRRMIEKNTCEGPISCHCFAGLITTAVPVKLGSSIIAYLKTGQIFHRQPNKDDFEKMLEKIGRKLLSAKIIKNLHSAYFQTRAVDPQRYNAMITLLKHFAAELGQHAESLAIINEGSEPATVTRARSFIHSRLNDSLTLEQVAHEAGTSESHFCRLFKEATGLTLTDYVNRCRIEWTKKELLNSDQRISEIAFKVGYQSLSQFNRSFARIIGTSPTNWRRQRLSGTQRGKRSQSSLQN